MAMVLKWGRHIFIFKRYIMDTQAKKIYRPVVVVARIIDPKTDKTESTQLKTIDGRERREWIAKAVMHAVMNGKIIEFVNKDDDKE